jgi:phosphatidate cytidylyltransferase
MHNILIAIGCYLVLGAVGMYLGNKKVKKEIASERWLKYCTYVLITAAIIASITLHYFSFIAFLISVTGAYELFLTRKTESFSFALAVYLSVVAGFLYFALRSSEALQMLIYFQVLSFDAFCQVTGQLVGKTPIVKNISPTKTVEGLSGGIFFCLLSAIVAGRTFFLSTEMAVFLGMITSAAAFTGDILSSFYKRMAGIKDYSNLLPGQGGFLDRFDSFIMAGFVYSILPIFIPWIIKI